jgi:hypothetical protein
MFNGAAGCCRLWRRWSPRLPCRCADMCLLTGLLALHQKHQNPGLNFAEKSISNFEYFVFIQD